MHKKIEADLTSLAHKILQLKNKDDVAKLYALSTQINEKLAVLNYIQNYVATTPQETRSVEEITQEIFEKPVEVAASETVSLASEKPEKPAPTPEKKVEVKPEEPLAFELEETTPNVKNDMVDVGFKKTATLEEELKDAISADVATDLFEKAEKVLPKKKSLNETLNNNFIQVGLNDRIAFVKNLFNGSQEDFNRVLSQLNSFATEKEAKKFVETMVKPDYDWSDKEEYETRLNTLIERRFT